MFCHSLTTCGSFFIVHSLALSKLSSYLRGSALQRRWQSFSLHSKEEMPVPD